MNGTEFIKEHLPQIKEGDDSYLKKFPEVKKLLESEFFEKVTLVRSQVIQQFHALFFYDVVAPKLSPHYRAALMREGLIKKSHNSNAVKIEEDTYRMQIGYFGYVLQLFLKFVPDENPKL